jgi:hypothetical protein
MTVFTPLKVGNFLNKMKNLFKRSSTWKKLNGWYLVY